MFELVIPENNMDTKLRKELPLENIFHLRKTTLLAEYQCVLRFQGIAHAIHEGIL